MSLVYQDVHDDLDREINYRIKHVYQNIKSQ